MRRYKGNRKPSYNVIQDGTQMKLQVLHQMIMMFFGSMFFNLTPSTGLLSCFFTNFIISYTYYPSTFLVICLCKISCSLLCFTLYETMPPKCNRNTMVTNGQKWPKFAFFVTMFIWFLTRLFFLHCVNNLLYFGAEVLRAARSRGTSEETVMKDFFVHLFARKNEGVEEQRLCYTCGERRTYDNGGHMYWKWRVTRANSLTSHV